MAGLKQSKRVSWAPPVKLCQVRFFLSDEAPAQSGSGPQDQLQAKASWLWHTNGAGPAGFNAPRPILNWPKTAHIPVIRWKTPAKFSFCHEWLVVAGEESTEVELQNKRQLGIFEAIYPRLSSIPTDPISSEPSDFHGDDPPPALIPVIAVEDDPVEEEESGADLLPELGTVFPETFPKDCEKPKLSFLPGVEPNVMAAASAAFTALIKTNEAGSLIDPELLIKILSNPSLIEKLLSDQRSQDAGPVQAISNTKPLVGPATAPIRDVSPAGDASYFKTLIQQHGVEGGREMVLGHGSFDVRQNYAQKGVDIGNPKPKIPKLCAFFNSPRGCRHGASCMYVHDASLPQGSDPPSSKKIKLDKKTARRV